jgi:hypothetical protein
MMETFQKHYRRSDRSFGMRGSVLLIMVLSGTFLGGFQSNCNLAVELSYIVKGNIVLLVVTIGDL